MPTRNVAKVFIPDAYYHVYNRGWNRGRVFLDESDYTYFEHILTRYLSDSTQSDEFGREYRSFYPGLSLVSYCLMGNHFHLLLYQGEDEHLISQFMASLSTAYTAYFNRKYKRRGSVFESSYKAVVMTDDAQLMHITRYIHLNHSDYSNWRHSSYRDYVQADELRGWVHPESILELFNSRAKYTEFTADYEDIQKERDEIKHELFGD